MWRLLQGAFFRGGALLVSVLVILFGVLRIYGVSYVTTVLDRAAASVVIFMLAGVGRSVWGTNSGWITGCFPRPDPAPAIDSLGARRQWKTPRGHRAFCTVVWQGPAGDRRPYADQEA